MKKTINKIPIICFLSIIIIGYTDKQRYSDKTIIIILILLLISIVSFIYSLYQEKKANTLNQKLPIFIIGILISIAIGMYLFLNIK